MTYVATDETRYYSTNETVVLPNGSRPLLAREDGTKWVHDSDGQLFPIDGVFNEAEMTDHANGKAFTHGKLRRDFESKWAQKGEFIRS